MHPNSTKKRNKTEKPWKQKKKRKKKKNEIVMNIGGGGVNDGESSSESYELEEDENENENDEEAMDTFEDIPDDMPPAPPPNLRELHMQTSAEHRPSVQFGFRKKSSMNSLDVTGMNLKQKRNNSLAIRVRSDSGKEKEVVRYDAPEQNITSQDNVNPLAFAAQKQKKRKKKKKKNTLSLNWSKKHEKKMKKKLRKQRLKQQHEPVDSMSISISPGPGGLGGIKEDSEESVAAINAFGGSPPAPPPLEQSDVPGPPPTQQKGFAISVSNANVPGP
eukprot:262682_1